MQVVLKFTNEHEARKALDEIRTLPSTKASVVAILAVCVLSVRSQGLNVCKLGIEMRVVLRLMFQVVLVTATPFANALTSKGTGRIAKRYRGGAQGVNDRTHKHGGVDWYSECFTTGGRSHRDRANRPRSADLEVCWVMTSTAPASVSSNGVGSCG